MPLPIVVKRINILAHDKNISVRNLQRVLNITVGTIQSWNRNSPLVESLMPIADYLKTSIDYLCGRTENPNMIDEFNELTESQRLLMYRVQKYSDDQISTINNYLDLAENFTETEQK